MTTAAERIVTALSDGPTTARDLSQRIEGIGYANIRQNLVRLAKAGVVTKLRRGLYGLSGGEVAQEECDSGPRAGDRMADCDTRDGEARRPPVVTPKALPAPHTAKPIERAIAAAWSDFEALNNPLDHRAWATLGSPR